MSLGGRNSRKRLWVFVWFLNIFAVSSTNLPGKWEQVDSERTSNKCNWARVAGWQAFVI